MTGFSLICLFLLTISIMIVAIAKYKVHPFIAIMSLSITFGLIAGIPIIDKEMDGVEIPGIATVVGSGFSGTFMSIGIVIILGALIGNILEATGAAMKFADMIIKAVGKKHPILAMELMGWVVSIAVFCDSGFVILNPIRKALVQRTATSSVAMTFGLSSGLYLSHVFIPPTPGPIAAASTLGIGDNLLIVMLFGVICSIFPFIAGLFYANHIGKKIKADDERDEKEIRESYDEIMKALEKAPNGFSAMMPIALPLVLMSLASAVVMMNHTGTIADILKFLGTPFIALAVGTICAVIQLFACDKGKCFYEITNDTLKVVGPILFITAAGGVLGKVIASTDMVLFIMENADFLKSIGIFFPFLLSAVLKTAQGSSTVALTTTAGIIVPLLPALGFTTPVQTTLVCMAISAGAMTVSHANDSYFWVVTNFGALSPERGYKIQTLGTLILGLAAIFEIYLLSLIFK